MGTINNPEPAVAEVVSFEPQQEQERTPLLATKIDVQIIVDDIPDDLSEVSSEGRKVGAGIAVGIIAAPFCGPVPAVLVGVAAAYGTTQPGAAGDACRAAGDIALAAKEKAIEVIQKHENLKKMVACVACTLKNVADALQYAAGQNERDKEEQQ